MTAEAKKTGRLLMRLPITLRMALIGLMVGLVVWLVLDKFQTRSLHEIFEAEFASQLERQAEKDRLRFDQSVRGHSNFIRLLAGQASLRDHIINDHADWFNPVEASLPAINRREPRWLPPRSVLRSFSTPDFIVMMDAFDRPRSVYVMTADQPPPEIIEPSQRLIRLTDRQTLITGLGGRPYLLASTLVLGMDGRPIARIMSASEINSRFLLNTQGVYLGSENMVALMAGTPLRVLASSNPDLLAPGLTEEEMSREFMFTGKSFFDYGSAELQTTFATLISRKNFEDRIQPILKLERIHRTVLALLLMLSFIALLVGMSQRIRNLVDRVDGYMHEAFGQPLTVRHREDELTELEDEFTQLIRKVAEYREALERETLEKLELAARQIETMAENDRLHMLQAVTDALGIGVIRIQEGKARAVTPTMERFIDDCGAVEGFVPAGNNGGDIELIDAAGHERVFDISRPSGLNEEILLVHDVTSQRRTERELWNLALYPSQNPMPVLRISTDGTLLHANPASGVLLRFWKCKTGEKVPDDWREIIHQALESRDISETDIQLGEKTISLAMVPIPQAGYVNIYGQDVTARKTAEEALQKTHDHLEALVDERTMDLLDEISVRRRAEAEMVAAKEQAEAANRAKTEFLTNMSHELRTPLNAVIGFSEMMAAEVFGPIGHDQYKGYAQDINSSGRHLLEIINDILDVSKIEVGQMELSVEDVDTAHMIEASLRLVRERAERADIVLRAVDIPAALPKIKVDPRRTKQILLNLLSNAIKFTPKGGWIELRAKLDGDHMSISIADNGIGMTEEEIAIAMTPFGQVDSRLQRKYEGTGLGLPLSRAFAELQGGTLAVASRKNKGTTVTVRLPLAE